MPINTSPQYVDLKNILHHPDKSITYISNPKAACSTIKNSLLGGCTGNVHRAIEEICEYPNDSNHEIITITRNPYSRAISCYKNKIGWGKETTGNVWLPFARAFGFNAHAKPTFLEFLKALSSTKINPSQFDIHYRPQVFTLHSKDITPSYIGRIEDINSLKLFLEQNSIKLLTRNPRPTGSTGTYRDEINPEEASLIRLIYAEDFAHYGYSTDLSAMADPVPIRQKPWISERYQLRFRLANLGLTNRDLKRIAARHKKSGNLMASLILKQHLLTMRPNSSKLRASISQLEERIRAQQNKNKDD